MGGGAQEGLDVEAKEDGVEIVAVGKEGTFDDGNHLGKKYVPDFVLLIGGEDEIHGGCCVFSEMQVELGIGHELDEMVC